MLDVVDFFSFVLLGAAITASILEVFNRLRALEVRVRALGEDLEELRAVVDRRIMRGE